MRVSHLTEAITKYPTITRALQSGGPRLGRHLPSFLVAPRQRVPNRAIDPQPIIGGVDPRRREMTAYVEQFRRGQVRIDPIERHLQIRRLLLSNDEARRRGLTRLVGVLHF